MARVDPVGTDGGPAAAVDQRFGEWKDALCELVRVPGVSAAGFPADDLRRSARGHRRACSAGSGSRTSPSLELPGVPPYVYGDWLHAPGRADRARLRPPRRRAAGAGREVDEPAVPSGREEGTALRPRHGRRQGRLSRLGRGRRRVPRQPPAACPVNLQVPDRGRGGDRARPASRPSSSATARSWTPTSWSSPTPTTSRPACRRSPGSCAASCRWTSR